MDGILAMPHSRPVWSRKQAAEVRCNVAVRSAARSDHELGTCLSLAQRIGLHIMASREELIAPARLERTKGHTRAVHACVRRSCIPTFRALWARCERRPCASKYEDFEREPFAKLIN